MEESLEEKEIRIWRNKLLLAWLLTLPIMALMYSGMIFGKPLVPMKIMTWAALVLAFPVIFVVGWSTIKTGLKGFYTFYFNMDSLIAMGTVAAYLTGILSFFGHEDYSGVSAMIMTIFITGKYIESKAKGRASLEIRKLLELGARKAAVLKGGKETEIPAEEVKTGDVMVVRPGEKIPTDGVVVKGSSYADESMVTGESAPAEKKAKSEVIGATINQDGVLHVKATKVGSDTFLARIIELVEEAQGTKLPIQKLADKITNVFVPAILALALVTFAGWLVLTQDLSRSVGVAISVLVIACPCSLGLATPIALMVGSGMGAKQGILIRKGEAIQTMKEVKTLVFDKTGTITKGRPEVTDVYTLPGSKEKDMLAKSASLENLSEHPAGRSVVEHANLKTYKPVKEFKAIRGKGVAGTVDGRKMCIGNSKLMEDRKIPLSDARDALEKLENDGKTTMIVAEGKKVLGVIGVADGVKEDSKQAISKLVRSGYEVAMITGDNERTAKAVGREVGISNIIANVLPEDKLKKIEELQKRGMVAFVGDGINDAPALKQANVGIAMGTGTDIAMESGDIVLAKGSLKGVVQSITLSKATFSKIKQNLFWAFAYNTVAIPLAVAGMLHPVVAEIAMALSSITVVANANLLRRKKISSD